MTRFARLTLAVALIACCSTALADGVTPFCDVLYWHASAEASSVWSNAAYAGLRSPPKTCRSIGIRVSASDSGISWTNNRGTSSCIGPTSAPRKTPTSRSGATGGRRSFPSSSAVSLAAWSTASLFFSQGSIDWNLNYNTIDLELGRSFAIGQSAWIRPSMGIKAAVIEQDVNLSLGAPRLIPSMTAWKTSPTISGESGRALESAADGGFRSATAEPRRLLRGRFLIRPVERQRRLYQDRHRTIRSGSTGLHHEYDRFVSACPCSDISSVSNGSVEGEVTLTAHAGYELQWWANQQRMLAFQQLPMHGDLTFEGLTCGVSLASSLLPGADRPESSRPGVLRRSPLLASDRAGGWAMNTNASPIGPIRRLQDAGFRFRHGIPRRSRLKRDWGVKLVLHPLLYRRRRLGDGRRDAEFPGQQAEHASARPRPIIQSGDIQAAIDYNVLDLDFGKSFSRFRGVAVTAGARPEGGVDQSSVRYRFSNTWSNAPQWADLRRTHPQRFLGNRTEIGHRKHPEFVARARKCKVDLTMNFYTAYLLRLVAHQRLRQPTPPTKARSPKSSRSTTATSAP